MSTTADVRVLHDLADLAGRLRAAGVDVDSARVGLALAAIAELGPVERSTLYWGTRLTLCSGRSDLRVFDTAFAEWIGDRPEPAEGGCGRAGTAARLPALVAAGASARPEGGAASTAGPGVGAAAVEVLTRRDLATLTGTERAEINILVAALATSRRADPSRRYRPGGRRTIDPAGTFRTMLRNGGEPARWRYRRRVVKPRRLTLLVDVSESMNDYSDALLRFAHAALVAESAATEVFTLGTRCTRVTRALAVRDVQLAMAALAAAEPYRGGGTRLGRCLRDFLRAHGGNRCVRSAIVVIASDGHDCGPLALLAGQVERLSRLAYRLIWVNPQQGWPGFQPMAPGLVASLRYVDLALPGHSFEALRDLAAAVREVGRR